MIMYNVCIYMSVQDTKHMGNHNRLSLNLKDLSQNNAIFLRILFFPTSIFNLWDDNQYLAKVDLFL